MFNTARIILPAALLHVAFISTAQAATVTETKITANDANVGDGFGWSVGVSGTTAVVGSVVVGFFMEENSSAYLFDTTTGTQIVKLTAEDGKADDRFGGSVAISGTTAIVGARSHNGGGKEDSGAAYLFDTTTGTQIAKLTARDADTYDSFGSSVAISGTTAIVGAWYDDDAGPQSGAAYLFDTTTGAQIAKLTAEDADARDIFGYSVAISGTTAIVGAISDEDGGVSSGSAYLFDTTTGTQIAKLTAEDADAHDRFGTSVAISGATAIVGARGDDDRGRLSGSAYLFDTTTGAQIAKLTAEDGAEADLFGSSVAISGTTAVVGSRFNDHTGRSSGAAYLFDITSGAQIDKLTAFDGAAADQFGYSVAISDTNVIVGALRDDDAGTDSGSAYIYSGVPNTPAPVPLPAGVWLLASALGFLGFARRLKGA